MCNPGVFSILTELYNCHHCLILEQLHNKAVAVTPHSLNPPPSLIYSYVDLPVLDISYQWDHIIHVFLTSVFHFV